MKYLLTALLIFSSSVFAKESNPKQNNPYVETGRIEYVGMTGAVDVIITDKKTGCQYMTFFGYSAESVLLGCFDEYKDPKFQPKKD